MQIKFEDIKIEEPGRSNKSPLEVTLFQGIKPNMCTSSVPCAYARDKKSDEPGIVLVGYVNKVTIHANKDTAYISMTPDRLSPEQGTVIGGWEIYKGSIHS